MADSLTAASPRGRGGFTMIETLVVLLIMGVVIAIAAPSFQRAVEKARADVAIANLRAICAAERFYWLENRAYNENLSALAGIDLLPTVATSSSGTTPLPSYQYSVESPVNGNSSAFLVTAQRINSTRWQGSFTIDQTGTITGQIQDQESDSSSPYLILAPNGL